MLIFKFIYFFYDSVAIREPGLCNALPISSVSYRFLKLIKILSAITPLRLSSVVMATELGREGTAANGQSVHGGHYFSGSREWHGARGHWQTGLTLAPIFQRVTRSRFIAF